jgi:hypothetical protein
MLAFCTDIYEFVNNIQLLSDAREKQKWFPFGLLSSYKMFRAVISNKTTQVFMQRFLYFFDLNQICKFSTDFPTSPQYQVSRKSFQCDLR